MSPSDAQELIHMTQRTIDGLNEFPAHQVRLVLADLPAPANASQQVISDGASISGDDEDVALKIRLIPVETGTTPRAALQPYSPTLYVYYSADQIPRGSSADTTLAGFLAQELKAIFSEEQARLAYLISSAPGTDTSKLPPLSHEKFGELERLSTRVLKYAPTYHLTFSLFTPSYAPSAWDIESACVPKSFT
jgi:phosphatidylinositol glycan class S